MISQGYKVSMKQAAQIKQLSEQGILNEEIVDKVIRNTFSVKPRTTRTKSVVVKAAVIKKYFPATAKEDLISDTIDKALEMYFNNFKTDD